MRAAVHNIRSVHKSATAYWTPAVQVIIETSLKTETQAHGAALPQGFKALASSRDQGTECQRLNRATAMLARLSSLLRSETAATSIEYALIAALISVAAVTVLSTVGSNLTGTFSTVARKL